MMDRKRLRISAVLALVGCLVLAGHTVPASGAQRPRAILSVRDQGGPGDFPLVASGQATPVWVDTTDFKVVRIASELFAEDVQRVSGLKPVLAGDDALGTGQAVLIGTLGHSALIDRLVAEKKLDADSIRGQWESHLIVTIQNPLPNLKSALVIVGSDRRGTAYGVFTLSEAMGVSPWYWWADVVPAHRSQLCVAGGIYSQGSPSVKYRGIFLNDEVFGIRPWAMRTFEPDRKDIGPKTHARIFELLLRLKANYFWPAMCRGHFNVFPENKQVADDYAIVVGSSHCEPMLLNNMEGCGEWSEKTDGPWNFITNRPRIIQAWEKRLNENGKYENSYTIGLRGVSDRPIQGGTTIPEKVSILQQAIDEQRKLLAQYVTADLKTVSQVFCPYQEVLTLYRAGVKVPDDVTLLWPDDNFGYIRQLPTQEEQKRSGRSGVYYHFAYWTWVWLCPISPSLTACEMRKAYDYGADRVWVFNVGDIKPAEKELTFAMQMAWDIHRWTPQTADNFMAEWAGETFGVEFAPEIASIMRDYYRMASRGIPEFLEQGWGAIYTPQELTDRLKIYRRISDQAEELGKRIPARLQDAYYQLVLYPVKGSRLVNEKVLLARKSLDLAAQGDATAVALAEEAAKANEQVEQMGRYYNEQMVNGKWNHMMGWCPHRKPVVATAELVEQGKAGKTKRASAPVSDFALQVAARDFVRKHDRSDAVVTVLPGLGFSDGVSLLPFTAPSLKEKQLNEAAWVEYDLELPAGSLLLKIRTLPTHPIHEGRGVRYGVSLDGGKPTLFDIEAENDTPPWLENVKRGYSVQSLPYAADLSRKVKVRIYLLDPGVVLQDIAVECVN